MSGKISNNNPGLSADDAEQKAAESNLIRKCVDYHNPSVLDTSNRLFKRKPLYLQPHSSFIRLMTMPSTDSPASTFFTTYCAHTTRAKNSSAITCCSWTPGGRRLLTGNADGEFTLWDGIHFGFELIMSAHDSSFRCMAWSHHCNYLLTSDAAGNIKYWTPSIAPVQSIDAHAGQAIHALTFSPADTKFASAGDDATVRIWDWGMHREERVLEGHGWDVKSVDWHPRSALLASGSKDNLVKLWDARTGKSLSTLYGHKNTVTKVQWNPNGNWLLTASRDQTIKVYDIRSMKELMILRGHNKEVTSVAWHPLCQNVFASGGMDGTLIFWNVGVRGSEEPGATVPFAHDMAIWDLQWHPAGHMLATASNDKQTKFWARNRLGSTNGLESVEDVEESELLEDQIELGNHVGIVIGRKGQTIISMQRATGAKMHVDQVRRTLIISGTERQLNLVRQRVNALLERVSNEERRDGMDIG